MIKKYYEKTRNCKNCNVEIKYSTKHTYIYAEKNNSKCKKCACCGPDNPMYGRYGDKNPFYGKKHSNESKKSMSEKNKIAYFNQSDEYKISVKAIMKAGANHKHPYDIWLVKYGKEKADELKREWREKIIKNAPRGAANHMFGKPSPKRSGNGYSGYYKGNIYFRSLLELSYIINYLEKNNLDWCSGESQKYKIEYTDTNGDLKNYFPDFVINDSIIIECKPKSLFGSKSVIQKQFAAIEFCKKRNMTYQLISPEKMQLNEVIQLHDNNIVIFDESTEVKYQIYIKNKKLYSPNCLSISS